MNSIARLYFAIAARLFVIPMVGRNVCLPPWSVDLRSQRAYSPIPGPAWDGVHRQRGRLTALAEGAPLNKYVVGHVALIGLARLVLVANVPVDDALDAFICCAFSKPERSLCLPPRSGEMPTHCVPPDQAQELLDIRGEHAQLGFGFSGDGIIDLQPWR